LSVLLGLLRGWLIDWRRVRRRLVRLLSSLALKCSRVRQGGISGGIDVIRQEESFLLGGFGGGRVADETGTLTFLFGSVGDLEGFDAGGEDRAAGHVGFELFERWGIVARAGEPGSPLD
jgi:hypothetical protein